MNNRGLIQRIKDASRVVIAAPFAIYLGCASPVMEKTEEPEKNAPEVRADSFVLEELGISPVKWWILKNAKDVLEENRGFLYAVARFLGEKSPTDSYIDTFVVADYKIEFTFTEYKSNPESNKYVVKITRTKDDEEPVELKLFDHASLDGKVDGILLKSFCVYLKPDVRDALPYDQDGLPDRIVLRRYTMDGVIEESYIPEDEDSEELFKELGTFIADNRSGLGKFFQKRINEYKEEKEENIIKK